MSLLNFTDSIYDSFSCQLTFCYRFAHSLMSQQLYPSCSPSLKALSLSCTSPFSFILCKVLPCFLLVLNFSLLSSSISKSLTLPSLRRYPDCEFAWDTSIQRRTRSRSNALLTASVCAGWTEQMKLRYDDA